jgi:photosynthetic reaction center cytochrome c subunit
VSGLRHILTVAAIVAAGALAGCGEAPPMKATQVGYRGTGLDTIQNPRLLAALRAVNGIPATPYALDPDTGGERASHAYQNVQVLGDLSTDQFNHLMASITQWVAPPAQGCNYCHNPNNMASDAVYTKVVARRMLQMTRNINANWTSHVQGVGVTCWTCHRGNAVPKNVWNEDPNAVGHGGTMFGTTRGIGSAGHNSVKYASLPYDPFTPYLLGAYPIRVQSRVPVDGPEVPIKATEATYGLMMHMSGSLGVNCNYCHNSRSWSDWSQSRPQRVTAWYGIRMVRNINNDYIQKLAWAMPTNRKGPLGDPYKVNCATCHQGLALPLYGVSMRKEHPQLWGPVKRDVGGIALPGVPANAVPQANGQIPTVAGITRVAQPAAAKVPIAGKTAAATPPVVPAG